MLISKIKPNKRKTYPYLGIHKSAYEHVVVLFFKRSTGIVVYSLKGANKLGTYLDYWDDTCFEYFNGKVILNND